MAAEASLLLLLVREKARAATVIGTTTATAMSLLLPLLLLAPSGTSGWLGQQQAAPKAPGPRFSSPFLGFPWRQGSRYGPGCGDAGHDPRVPLPSLSWEDSPEFLADSSTPPPQPQPPPPEKPEPPALPARQGEPPGGKQRSAGQRQVQRRRRRRWFRSFLRADCRPAGGMRKSTFHIRVLPCTTVTSTTLQKKKYLPPFSGVHSARLSCLLPAAAT